MRVDFGVSVEAAIGTSSLPQDLRSGKDRRRRATPVVSRYTFFGGRREADRRAVDGGETFVDRYPQTLFLIASGVLLLNMLDAYFTLLLLSHGGEELNPVADWLLYTGHWAFILTKTVGIGLCTMTLVMIHRFRGAKFGICLVGFLYLLLLGWHFLLMGRI